ncbi:hypothetical protein [Pseudomonas sp. GZD-222]|uniref:hypothetical protein n=1 Tax=Pseudomonas sp. GZD-222 TaxID=3404805 RepID=UPI003BB4D837
MLDIRGFDPQMPWCAHRVAEGYSQKLATLGSWLFLGCGALFLVPLTQSMALSLAMLLVAIAAYLGREYRKYVEEFIKHTSVLKLAKIFAPTWRYVLMTTILLGVGLGQNEWSFFAEQKDVFITLFVSGGAFDLIKGFLASK